MSTRVVRVGLVRTELSTRTPFKCGVATMTHQPHVVVEPESAIDGPKRDGKIRGKLDVTPIDHPDHYLNWLQCMRSGETPNASIDAGFQHAVAVLMAVLSYDTGRKTTYDPVKRQLSTA
jgi:hypothetical protein